MSTAIQTQALALPTDTYLNSSHGIKSCFLTKDHKRIGILYLVSISLFFLFGGTMASMIRLELLTPAGDLVQSDTYNKLFTMHGIVRVFFFLVPSIPATLGNFVLPIMIGARDLAFPKINLLSWYLFVIGAGMIGAGIISGGIDTGWTFTVPLSTQYVNTNVVITALGIFVAGFASIF